MAHAFTQSKKFAAILHLPELESGSHASSGIRAWKAGIIPLDHRCTIYTVGGVFTFVLFSRAMICRFRYSYKCICHSAGGLIVSHFLQPDASPEYAFSCYSFSLGVLEANAWNGLPVCFTNYDAHCLDTWLGSEFASATNTGSRLVWLSCSELNDCSVPPPVSGIR